MDPLTAIGFVSNIISFVDFGSKLLSKAREIAHSADGALAINLDLELVAEDLRAVSANLRDGSPRSGLLSPSDQRLEVLRHGCVEVADQLIEALDGFKIKGDKGPLKSLHQASKILWKKEMLEGLAQRLSMYREQLDTHFLVDLRLNVNRIAIQNSESYRKLNQRTQFLFDTILANNTNVSEIGKLQTEHFESLRRTIFLKIDEQHDATGVQIDGVATFIEEHTSEEHEATRSQVVMKLSKVVEEGIETVLAEGRGNAAETSTKLDEVLAAVQRQADSIAEAVSLRSQFHLEIGNYPHTTSYVEVGRQPLVDGPEWAMEGSTFEGTYAAENEATLNIGNNFNDYTGADTSAHPCKSSFIQLPQKHLQAVLNDNLKAMVRETCMEFLNEPRFSSSRNLAMSNSRSQPAFVPTVTNHSCRKTKRSDLHESASVQTSGTSDFSNKASGPNNKRSKRQRQPKPKTQMKLQWKKRFQMPWGTVTIRSDLLIKGDSSFVRFEFGLMPNPLFSSTIFWSAFEKQVGTGSLSNFALRTFNLRPRDAPIFEASGRHGDARTLRTMLLLGEASPFDVDERGLTPLHEAVLADRYDLCEILVAHGAAIDADFGFLTPLHQYNLGKVVRNPKILRLLLRNGACPSQVNSENYDFWYPIYNRRSLNIEELQILAPYRGINEKVDYSPCFLGLEYFDYFHIRLPLSMSNVLIGSYSGTLTVGMIDGLKGLGATFFDESILLGYRVNVHHLVLYGFRRKEIETRRAVMVSVLARLIQLFPDKHARGPYSDRGSRGYTTTCFARKKRMLDTWLDALIASGEDIFEFLRVDNDLIVARGGGPDDFNFYTPSKDLSDDSEHFKTDSDYAETDSQDVELGGRSINWYHTKYSSTDLFGAALRSQWGEDVLDIDLASLLLLFWASWFALPNIVSSDASHDILGASLRSELSEDIPEVDYSSLLVMFWGSWNILAYCVIGDRYSRSRNVGSELKSHYDY